MTKKMKKTLSSIIVTLMLSTGVTGIIANATYSNFKFKLSRSSTDYSEIAVKSVIHSVPDHAKIYPLYGTAADCPIGIGVVNANDYALRAYTVWFDSLEAQFPTYQSPAPGAGTELRLKGVAGYYYTEMEGVWEP